MDGCTSLSFSTVSIDNFDRLGRPWGVSFGGRYVKVAFPTFKPLQTITYSVSENEMGTS